MKYTIGIFSLSLVALASPAYAQTEPAPQEKTDAALADTPRQDGLQDIVVTAQRRAEPLQRVPLTVSALTSATIATLHISNFSDVAKVAPGFVSGANYGYIRYSSLRGIGNNQFGFADDPSIAMFVDGVYQGRGGTGMQVNALFDVDRIEVIKGPQATLFGRSSIGGAISIITKQPTFAKIGGEATIGVGNYGRFVGRAAINLPLSDNLAVRLAFDSENHTGYYPNLSGQGSLGALDVKAGRASLLYKNDAFTFDLKGTIERRKSSAYPIRTLDQPDFAVNLSNGGRTAPSDFDIYEGVAKFGYEFSNTFSGSLAVSGRQVKNLFSLDYDARPAIIGGPYTQYTDDRLLQADLIFNYSDDHLSGSFGASAFSEKLDGWIGNWVDSTLAFTGVASTNLAPNNYSRAFYEYGKFRGKFHGYSFFADGTYTVVPGLRLTAGVRYNSDTKRYTHDIPNPATLPENAGKAFAGAYYNWGYYTSTPITSGKTWTDLSSRASISYDINPKLTTYFSFSEGWKAGGIDTFRASTPGAFAYYFGRDISIAGGTPQVYNPEHSTNYELGLKGRFFRNKVSANLSLYNYDYSDLQVAVTRGASTIVANVGKARGRGVEFELRARPIPEFEFFSNTAYSSTKIRSFPDNPAQEGLPLNLAPKWSGAAGATVHFVGMVPGDLSLQGDMSYRSNYRTDNSPVYRVPGFALVNFRLGYTDPSGRYTATVYVENAFDKFTAASGGLYRLFSAAPSDTQSVFGDPRTFGADVTVKF